MKLYDGGMAPNPRRVRVFLAEKNIKVELVPVDLTEKAHKSPDMTALNPMQRVPVLELDDGTVITESVAICRYFEEITPEPALFGSGAVGRAQVEMWNRRLELHFMASVAAAFRHCHPAMAGWEVPQLPEWGEANRPKALAFLDILDTHLAENEFVAGEAFSIADITGMIAFEFMKPARIGRPEHLGNVMRWYQAVSARPSARA
ncbi:glutathione S-transferase family protein [Pseudohoeflea coraliihabitans]|uniref:glutathione transferase n=1 Tax=Pseudohoeflea coraliihabitans TaxID=2860393 RepID=A0ABS6WSD6_9HYPH|nr:glutathione S-transferase [Pseudohoeflea sp. DP4N28-3]MBW3097995.1 glutathione S-transferase [Pseudohoeflea sp. DP4N28-3]